MSLKVFFAAFCFFSGSLLGVASAADEYKIFLKTTPAFKLLRPVSDPVTIALLVTHADGRPIEQGSVSITLDAPQSSALLSTDFPSVENSRLLAFSLPLRQGRAQWKYVFPIRGNYRLAVDLVSADGEFESKNFVIPVTEHRLKWFWLGLLCAGLFAVGVIAGRIFTVIPGTVGMVCILIGLGLAGNVIGDDSDKAAVITSRPATALEISAVTVGRPTRLQWHASSRATLLSLTIFHLEMQKTMFAIERVPVPSDFKFDFQFPDSAEYRVSSVAEVAGGEPVRGEQLVSVAAVEPPIMAQVPALLFFLAIIALGLSAGRISKTFSRR